MKKISLYNDKCEPVLDSFDENSIDNVVTDPPYGLQFMNKKWDYDVPSIDLWKKVYRVMKPGATLLCFAGTRTQHRMAVNIEDAGFVLKDVIMWFYGTGFPKATDISKQLDKQAGQSLKWFIDYVLEVAEEKSITKKQLTELFLSKNGLPTGWLYNKATGNQSLTLEQYNKLKDFLDLPFGTLEEAEREIIGKKRAGLGSGETYAFTDNNKTDGIVDITLPSTTGAKLWDGWKSHALKPAYEPIIMAVKPNESSYAENALKWGTAGLNIDDSRIKLQDENPPTGSAKRVYKNNQYTEDKIYGENKETPIEGRYPANVILSHHPECNEKCHPDCPIKILDEQAGVRKSGSTEDHHNLGDKKGEKFRDNEIYGVYKIHDNYKPSSYGDTGKASRFFYCAKTSQAERNMGCGELDNKKFGFSGGANQALKKGEDEYLQEHIGLNKIRTIKNHHPTVKPIKLMEYLCKLISNPENNLYLDPFMGSGSTGIAVSNLGFDFIGIEMDKEYFEIAEKRIGHSRKEKIKIEKRQELFDNFFE